MGQTNLVVGDLPALMDYLQKLLKDIDLVATRIENGADRMEAVVSKIEEKK